MNVIEFKDVWKKFEKGEKFNSLRDAIPYYLKLLARRKDDEMALKGKEFWALRGVDIEVKQGDILGIIGSNGAGKSTILKLLSKIMDPNKGEIRIVGRLAALIEVTAGFHPELTGRENVYLNGTILGMRKKEIDAKFDEIVDFSGLKDFINTPVKRYSSGMYSRLGFSVAAHMDPDIMLVDEVLSVGDMAFQSKCIRKMKQLLSSGATIVLVSHDLALVQNLCKRVMLLDSGKIISEGPANEIIPYYQDIVYKSSEMEIRKEINAVDYKVHVDDDVPVHLTNVTLLDSSSHPREKFKVGEPVAVKIDYAAKERIVGPIFSLEIIRSDSVLCCSSDTRADGFPINSIDGKGSIEIRLGEINLTPGVYIIKIAVWDKDMLNPYTVRKNDIIRFEGDGNRKHVTGGVFVKSFDWKY
jgi:ABC-type polysaccharide/polyol phosphate transport system ATPase subunit